MKRFLGMILVLAMLLTLLPGTALAAPENGTDYLSTADEAYANLKRNYVDSGELRVRPVMWGYHNGETTNNGVRVSFSDPGSLWENTVLLMAFDNYARLLSPGSERYLEVAAIIANTINYFISHQSRAELTQTPSSQNIAMDDCSWGMNGFILGYRYNTVLGRADQASACLAYAKDLFNNTYAAYYDSADGLLWYNTEHESKASYAGAFLLAGWDLYEITGEQSYLTKTQNVYNGIENGDLKRPDGLYSVAKHTNGRIEGINDDSLYYIRDGGSVTFLMGNTAMAVMHRRFGNDEKARLTSEAIICYMTHENGVLINDRDAWDNTFCFGPWVREVLNAGITDDSCFAGLFATADAVTREATFDDGYYSAAWNGPREPSSDGYPADFKGTRNGWGYQNGDSIQCGSTPKQIMTSATTANILFAAAAAVRTQPGSVNFSGDGEWLVGSAGIHNTRDYEIDYDLKFPKIAAFSGYGFADTGTLRIRNTTVDDYIIFSLQTYRNGNGYYIASSAQVWDRTQWSTQDFLWSDAFEAPVTSVHMKLNYTAASGEYHWIVTDNASGRVISDHAFPVERIPDALRTCGSCKLEFRRDGTPYTLSPQNFKLTYAAEAETDKTPFRFTGSGEWQTADIRPDNARSYELGFDLYLPGVAAGGSIDSSPDETILNLRNETTDDYLWFRIKSYINSSGAYQIGTAGQACAVDWGTEDFQWCRQTYADPVYSLHYTLTHDADAGTFTWKAVSNLDGSLLTEHTFAYDVPQSLADCRSCALMFRPGEGCALHNAYIAYAPEPTLRIASAYLRISEDINVIFTAELPEDCTDPYMIFSWQGRDIKVTDCTEGSDGRLCFELSRVVPQRMGDSITATVYAKKDGVTVSDTVEDYSIRAYCESQLEATNDAALITLLSDLLTYGAAAQTYTGYRTEALVTSGLDLTPSSFTPLVGKKPVFSGEKSSTADWYAATLGLANDLAMRFTFRAASVEGLSVDISVNGRTQSFGTFEREAGGRYSLMFRGIKATEFDAPVTAVFKLNGTPVGRTLTYSVNTYICSTQDCANETLASLVKALYSYGVSAAAYAGR